MNKFDNNLNRIKDQSDFIVDDPKIDAVRFKRFVFQKFKAWNTKFFEENTNYKLYELSDIGQF